MVGATRGCSTCAVVEASSLVLKLASGAVPGFLRAWVILGSAL